MLKLDEVIAAVENAEPDIQWRLLTHEQIVRVILTAVAPQEMTLKELANVVNDLTGLRVGDNSICTPLNLLKAKGVITDAGAKRPCGINGIRKKTWRFVDQENTTAQGNSSRRRAGNTKKENSSK